MIYAAIPALALWLAADLGSASAGLDLGYMQMYDLQFTAAHKTFADYAQVHPEDPLAPASDAAAYLFAEFDRLKILQSEFFVHDENFRRPKKLNSDPAVRRAFDADLVKADKLAASVLGNMPRDTDALFASILILGLRADFDGLIDKRDLSALASVRQPLHSGKIAGDRSDLLRRAFGGGSRKLYAEPEACAGALVSAAGGRASRPGAGHREFGDHGREGPLPQALCPPAFGRGCASPQE